MSCNEIDVKYIFDNLYDYVVIKNDLENCYSKIINLISAEISNGSKDYDLEYIRNHVEKLTS